LRIHSYVFAAPESEQRRAAAPSRFDRAVSAGIDCLGAGGVLNDWNKPTTHLPIFADFRLTIA
jgi:hypothetical protein